MRFPLLSLLLLAATALAAWSSEDLEIFHLQQDLVREYGPSATFYTFFELEDGEKSTFKQIARQFRKLSQKYHPDKAKRGVSKKKANKRFERLNLINNILKTDKRKRYDYFLDKGFPKYSTAGWIYAKFKPGIVFTIIFLSVLISVAHFVILKIQAGQNRKRIASLIADVKAFAQQQVAGNEMALGEQRKVKHEGLQKTFLVRIDGVFLCDDENENLLERVDPAAIKDPTWRDFLFVRWFAAAWNKVLGGVYTIDLSVKEEKQYEKDNLAAGEEKKKTKKKPTGEKKVLPNGKVIYSKKKN